MTRLIRAALALACVSSLAACNTTLPAAGTITTGDISAAAGTLPPTTVSSLRTKIAQVQSYAKTVCRIVPTVETIVNIFAASNPTAATVKSVTNIACGALLNAPAYAADMPARGKKAAAPVGSTVTSVVVVNGTPVRVTGKVVR